MEEDRVITVSTMIDKTYTGMDLAMDLEGLAHALLHPNIPIGLDAEAHKLQALAAEIRAKHK